MHGIVHKTRALGLLALVAWLAIASGAGADARGGGAKPVVAKASVGRAGVGKPLQRDVFRPWDAATKGNKRFLMVGDAGTGTALQRQVSRQMLKRHRRAPIASAWLLGDNVYPNGESKHFERSLAQPFRPLIEAGVRLFAVLGNHDIPARWGADQLAYLGHGTRTHYRMPLADGEVEVFALDTNLFVELEVSKKGDAATYKAMRRQLTWLRKALATSTARYKIVVGHHPIFSSGTMKFERDAVRPLQAILAEGGASAYVAGHQHSYERRPPMKGVTHFVSGGGGREPEAHPNRGRPPKLRHFKNHFLAFEVTDDGLQFEAIDQDGTVFDRGVLGQAKPKALRN